ncbi:MAG: hypothetical protein IKU55_03215 [Clostridia bacterium]|nr:hypothetical protein [Clostridia bacterium]
MAENNPLAQVMNTTDLTKQFSEQDVAEGKLMSILSYLWILFFLPLVVCPNSKFGRFHANQALVLFIVGVVFGVIGSVVGILGISVLSWIVGTVLGLVDLALVLLGIYFAATGKAKELPIIGKIRIIK